MLGERSGPSSVKQVGRMGGRAGFPLLSIQSQYPGGGLPTILQGETVRFFKHGAERREQPISDGSQGLAMRLAAGA